MSASVTLGAIDVFHLRTHQEMRAQGLPGNSCSLVLELAGPVDETLLRRRVEQARSRIPELRWRLSTDLRLNPVWRVSDRSADVLRVRRSDAKKPLLDVAIDLLEEPIDGRQPWRLDVLRRGERDAVVLRWFHPLTDALGASRLLAWLGGDQARFDDAPPPEKRRMAGERRLERMEKPQRMELARGYMQHMMSLGQRPILSLWGAGPKNPGRTRALRIRFSEEQTASFYASLRKRAKLADTSILLYASARLLDSALRARGYSPPQQLIPLPLSLDAKRDATRMLGNHLTMMTMALDRDDLQDEARCVASLAKQRRAIIRGKYDVGSLAAMDMVRKLPALLYNWGARRPFSGQRSSIVVSNPGVIDISEFLGARVVDAFWAPSVLADPGLQVVADRFDKRLGVTVMFRDGIIGMHEMRELTAELERDMLGPSG
jgi:hypothetical protein